jgi:hypothetical protein
MTEMGKTERRLTASATALVGAFQVALAAGAPWGDLAYGGANPGTLPAGYRAASAGAALAWGATTVAITRMPIPVTQRGRNGLAVLAAVGLVGATMNAISPSVGERALWAPVSLALGLGALRLRSVGSGSR